MPDVFEQLAQQLAKATGSPTTARRRFNIRSVVLIAAGTVGLAGTAAAALHWAPELGDSPQHAPAQSESPVPATQQAALGVLRREQTAQDRGADVERQLRFLSRTESRGIRMGAIRRLASSHLPGRAVVLIPHESFGEEETARGDLLRDPLCVSFPAQQSRRLDSSAFSCWSLAQILKKDAVAVGVGSNRAFLFGLVPDGVESVTVMLRDGSVARGRAANNFFSIESGFRQLSSTDVRNSLTWTDSAGDEIKP